MFYYIHRRVYFKKKIIIILVHLSRKGVKHTAHEFPRESLFPQHAGIIDILLKPICKRL